MPYTRLGSVPSGGGEKRRFLAIYLGSYFLKHGVLHMALYARLDYCAIGPESMCVWGGGQGGSRRADTRCIVGYELEFVDFLSVNRRRLDVAYS